MSSIVSRYCPPDGSYCTQKITPENAGWSYVGFEVYELVEGQIMNMPASRNESCLVLIGGKATVHTDHLVFKDIGDRMDPFERKKPYSIYINRGEKFTVRAVTQLELALCQAPSEGGHTTRLISPRNVGSEDRGFGRNRRYVQNILPESADASSLLVVEVFTEEGCTSSYPSHKHDTSNMPHETYLEETYYHRINPSQGFCFQRVYDKDRSLDESVAVYNKDVVKVPRGYHPVATIAGYNSYYLNVMAGPTRKWQFTWEEDHRWVNGDTYKNKHCH